MVLKIFQAKKNQLSQNFAEVLVAIEEAGGCFVVCQSFNEWFQNDHDVLTLGFGLESKSPFNQVTLRIAALNLASIAQSASDKGELTMIESDKAIKFAEFSFMSSCYLVDQVSFDEMAELCAKKGTSIEINNFFQPLKDQAEISWASYLQNGYDFSPSAMAKGLLKNF